MVLITVDNRVIQFKCKPGTVELIHFAMGGKMSRNVIKATAYNVFENHDELTIDGVVELLLEEFSSRQIEASGGLILKIVQEVNYEIKLREAILSEYEVLRSQGMDINLDKGEVMRHFSKTHLKKDMRPIFTILKGA